MKKIKNLHGELTTQQIVGLIILITSFVVILLFFFRLNLGEISNKEICHNSVVLAGKGTLAKITTGAGSLDCRTNYVCISGGEKCEGINPTQTIEIDLSKDNAKNETMKAIANEMADCWWMFGEGKIDYIGLNVEGAIIGKVNCAVCSQIKFSGDMKSLGTIDSNSFGNFLKNTDQSKIDTYLHYLYSTYNLDDASYFIRSINSDERYYVVTGIAQSSALSSVNNWFGGGIDLLNSFVPFIEFSKLDKSNDYGPFPVLTVNQEGLNKLGCDKFITKA